MVKEEVFIVTTVKGEVIIVTTVKGEVIIVTTVKGEVIHPRSKLAGYSTGINFLLNILLINYFVGIMYNLSWSSVF